MVQLQTDQDRFKNIATVELVEPNQTRYICLSVCIILLFLVEKNVSRQNRSDVGPERSRIWTCTVL